MSDNILSKKLKPPPEHPHDEAHAQDLGTIIRKSVALAALDQLKIGIEASSHEIKRVNTKQFVDQIWQPALNLVVTLDEDTTGLVCLDMPLVNTLADILTGDLEEAIPDALNQRYPTKTDASLCQGFVNQVLLELRDMLMEQAGKSDLAAFEVSHLSPEPSPHEFSDVSYQRATLELNIMDGARSGKICIILPADQLSINEQRVVGLQIDPEWQSNLKAAVIESRACLSAILHRKKMPIGGIMRLKVGDMLDIPANAIDDLSLETGIGQNTVRHVTARLGEFQEMRAAKIINLDRSTDQTEQQKMIE